MTEGRMISVAQGETGPDLDRQVEATDEARDGQKR